MLFFLISLICFSHFQFFSGPAIGGSTGILFTIGNAVACSMYLLALSETLVAFFNGQCMDPITGSEINDVRLFATIAISCKLFSCCFFIFVYLWGSFFFIPAPTQITKTSQKKDQHFSQGMYCCFFIFPQFWEHFFGLLFAFFFFVWGKIKKQQ